MWYKRLHHRSVISSALGLLSSFCLFVGAYQSGSSDPGLSGLPGQPHGLTERRHWGYEWTHQVWQCWRAHPQCYTWCFQLSCQGKKISTSPVHLTLHDTRSLKYFTGLFELFPNIWYMIKSICLAAKYQSCNCKTWLHWVQGQVITKNKAREQIFLSDLVCSNVN